MKITPKQTESFQTYEKYRRVRLSSEEIDKCKGNNPFIAGSLPFRKTVFPFTCRA
jgi:hypothetical protein